MLHLVASHIGTVLVCLVFLYYFVTREFEQDAVCAVPCTVTNLTLINVYIYSMHAMHRVWNMQIVPCTSYCIWALEIKKCLLQWSRIPTHQAARHEMLHLNYQTNSIAQVFNVTELRALLAVYRSWTDEFQSIQICMKLLRTCLTTARRFPDET